MVSAVQWHEGVVRILDQTRLPGEVVFRDCRHYEEVAECIRALRIRGAPAIGIAAAMGVALAAQEIRTAEFQGFTRQLEPAMDALLKTRPTAVNIRWAIERLRIKLEGLREAATADIKTALIGEAETILREDIEVNRAIGRYGAEYLKDGDTVLTHCNAGALATGGYGTATAPILTAIEQGKRIRVIADETRPVLQGARLTAWELMQSNVPVTLITDNSAGALMRKGMIQAVIVGTDRTVLNGDVANKIGTYSVAVLCKEHSIPFYVAAPMSSIDFTIPHGDLIPIEERDGREVTHIMGNRVAPEGVGVINMAFDVTPARYITKIITERGAVSPEGIAKLREGGA